MLLLAQGRFQLPFQSLSQVCRKYGTAWIKRQEVLKSPLHPSHVGITEPYEAFEAAKVKICLASGKQGVYYTTCNIELKYTWLGTTSTCSRNCMMGFHCLNPKKSSLLRVFETTLPSSLCGAFWEHFLLSTVPEAVPAGFMSCQVQIDVMQRHPGRNMTASEALWKHGWL